jgi:cephalosporin hydroxylase
MAQTAANFAPLEHTDPIAAFHAERATDVAAQGRDDALKRLSYRWIAETAPYHYAYNFCWMGRPVIQFPQDMLAMQEIIWRVQPDLIVETGIAHGGSLVYYASMLQLLGNGGRVLGIDIDIRAHNREALDAHPMRPHIDMIEGSSIAEDVIAEVGRRASGCKTVLVALDSNHTHEHVRAELDAYAPLVTQGSYLVVFDTVIEDMPPDMYPDRPWDRGDNPRTAVDEFLHETEEFEVDQRIEDKLLITVSPGGYLRRVGGGR